MRNWKKATMIMLMGLLVAGPIAPHYALAQGNMPSEGAHTALAAAQAAQDKAAKNLHETMASMDSMKKMPMTANEKEMMKMMGQMADTIKNLTEANKQLIEAIKELRKGQTGPK
jgi:maltodextrin utilization protein YvdJ